MDGRGQKVRVLLVFVLGDDVLEELVHRPRDGGGRCLVHDARLQPAEESQESLELVDRPERRGHAVDARDPLPGALLLGVEQRLAHVQRHRGCRGNGPGHAAGQDVGLRVVAPVVVQLVLHDLVGHEVDGLERDVHRQLGGEAAVEGAHALLLQDHPAAVHARPVGAPVHLHSLLHHWWKQNDERMNEYLSKHEPCS